VRSLGRGRIPAPNLAGENPQLILKLVGVSPDYGAAHLDDGSWLGIEPVEQLERQQAVRLPVPPPLDYDWRFTEATRVLLLRLIERLATHATDEIVLIGTPTLFQAARSTGMGVRCTLIDRCLATVSALAAGSREKLHTVDVLTGVLPRLSARVVMADPPWYEEFARAFLWASSQLVRNGGTVLLSAPPLGTRPGIEQEFRRLVAFANELGLELHSMDECLRYDSPPFEKNAMRAAGRSGVPIDWREGILARFEKMRDSVAARPNVESSRNNWTEHTVFGVRLLIRRWLPRALGNPRLVKIVDGDILDTVSRRDPRRELADVWTSGNRVYACSDTHTLAWILEAIRTGHGPESYVEEAFGRQLTPTERTAVIEATKQVSTVLSRELEEYALAWEL
jgi:hypothetical protein